MTFDRPWLYHALLGRRLCHKIIVTALLVLIIIQALSMFLTQPIRSITQRASRIGQGDIANFATCAMNNTVVVVPINSGMLPLAKNMLCSLSNTSFNTSSIVFWALDEAAQSALHNEGYTTYHDPSLFSVAGNQNVHGATDNYYRMMRERPKFFIDFLSTGYDLLMLDADIIFWQSPMQLVPTAVDRESVDIVYSTDSREFYTTHNAFQDPLRRGPIVPPICNGLFWMKSKKETISLWSEMLTIFEAPWWRMGLYRARVFQDDQRGMDVLLNDGRARIVGPFPDGITEDMIPPDKRNGAFLNLRLLDQTEVTNGQLYMFRQDIYKSNLDRLRKVGRNRIAVHMNWNTENISKSDGARMMNISLYEDGHCRI